MHSQILGLRVAGTVFGVVGLGHLLRLVTRVDILIAGHPIPLWPNMLGVALAGILSLWLWKLSCTATR